MIEFVYTCDHCKAKIARANGISSAFCSDDAQDVGAVHACSKEHLGFALAKAFGIPVDGDLTVKLEAAHARETDLAAVADARLTQLHAALNRAEKLQRQLSFAPPPVTSKDEQTLWDDAHHVARRDNRPVASVLMQMVVQLRAELLDSRRTSEKPEAFGEGFVERLAEAHRKAFNGCSGSLEDARHAGVRAILSELATVPCKLPTWSELGQAADDGSLAPSRMHRIENMLRARLAPVLAAKDAQIAELESAEAQWRSEAAHLQTLNTNATHRIAELEKRITKWANDYAMLTGGCMKFEKRLAEQSAPVDASEEQIEHLAVIVGENGGQSLSSAEMERIAKAMIVYFARHTMPVDAAGKTPGEVSVEARRFATLSRGVPFSAGYDTFDGKPVDIAAIESEAAQAVLRAFGGAEALRRVRKRMDGTLSFDEVIDSELAKLPQNFGPPTDATPSITDPQKPTKPLAEAFRDCFANGDTWNKHDHNYAAIAAEFVDIRVKRLAAYWEKGAAHERMHSEYRQALKDCVKELREEFSK